MAPKLKTCFGCGKRGTSDFCGTDCFLLWQRKSGIGIIGADAAIQSNGNGKHPGTPAADDVPVPPPPSLASGRAGDSPRSRAFKATDGMWYVEFDAFDGQIYVQAIDEGTARRWIEMLRRKRAIRFDRLMQ